MGWDIGRAMEQVDEQTFRREREGTWTPPEPKAFSAPARSSPTPQLVDRGPVEFSTCTDLVRLPVLIHDVNGYYRSLGVDPRATRKQLREAYQRRGGPNSPWLTYVLKQLLDPVVRREYDMSPLGKPYLDDYWMSWINAQAKMKAARAMALAHQQGVSIDSEQAERVILTRVYDAMGMRASWDDDTPNQVVDKAPKPEQDRPRPARDSLPSFDYSYYQWRSRCDDIERLAVWQDLLVRAFSRRRVNVRLAVGFHGRLPHPWVIARVGYRTVVFLNDRELPTVTDAAAVVTRVVQDQQSN